MCGIIGYVGTQAATEVLLSGLEKLEYRGYDSAGIATIWEGELNCIRAKGKLHKLRSKIEKSENPSPIGIGHTRWATHGKPDEHNAHPHMDMTKRIAVVQNGIIENYRELREQLKAQGNEFISETDTEVVPHLIAQFFKEENILAGDDKGSDNVLLEAVLRATNKLQGAFALAVICADYPYELIAIRQQAPLVIGFGQGEFFCASDTPAIISHTRAVLPLENGEIARLTPLGVEVYNFAGARQRKQLKILKFSPTVVEKQGFKHFMLKEIYEQPQVVRACLDAYFNSEENNKTVSPINLDLSGDLYKDLEQIQIVACGTSWHAALVGKYLIEQLSNIPTQVHYASEFRYAPAPMTANTLTIGVTQSGETADTLAALSIEKERRQGKGIKYQARLMGITNRPESTLGYMVPHIINTLAGIEIGVAATKTFTAQLMAFYALALDLATRQQTIPFNRLEEIIDSLHNIPGEIESSLENQKKLTEHLAHDFAETQDFIFLGRGINFPIALEGALKLKEISYIHAEGYPAGEMKHGPIALLDSKVPVVVIATSGNVYEKLISNAQEAKARNSRLIGVTSVNYGEATDVFDDMIPVAEADELLSPLLTVVPMQLLAYHIAARRGLDVDQPRNLAKSVTVE
ncbi:MAG TPA: glutamine--fructose-6-phosphate transaminase (isomerizing) [Richelia sp.]|nr:glutamine--fructose-6-phosphate transaminase (isomerizing) [Richelia sp.]